jgi:hypothetical protein
MVHLSFIAADWRKETARGREKEKEQREAAAALRATKTNYSSAGRRHFTIDRHFRVLAFCVCAACASSIHRKVLWILSLADFILHKLPSVHRLLSVVGPCAAAYLAALIAASIYSFQFDFALDEEI